jgi:hypothetical protein
MVDTTARAISLNLSERMHLGKRKIDLMVGDLMRLIALHENNKLITYSPLLTKQIPTSFAANAFNVFQESLHRYEIVRICTFWDGIDLDKSNIPTVVEIVDDPAVIGEVVSATQAAWLSQGTRVYSESGADPTIQAEVEIVLQRSQEQLAERQAVDAKKRLVDAIAAARTEIASPRLARVMNLRNKHLAHSLEKTRAEQQGNVAPMKYGDEKGLLDQTIHIVDQLHISVNGRSFDWDASREIAQRNAKGLWENCTFDIRR